MIMTNEYQPISAKLGSQRTGGEMVFTARSNIVCLQETKLSSLDTRLAMEFLGQVHLPAKGTRGGLQLAWDSETILISDLESHRFSISASVRVLASNADYNCVWTS